MYLCKKNTSSTASGFVEVDSSGRYTIWVSDGDFYQKDSSPWQNVLPSRASAALQHVPRTHHVAPRDRLLIAQHWKAAHAAPFSFPSPPFHKWTR